MSQQKPFTVIGVVEESGQIVCHHVMAESDLNAFAQAASLDSFLSMVAALPGHISEGQGISFPGEGMVCSETVLEQPDVFGEPTESPNHIPG